MAESNRIGGMHRVGVLLITERVRGGIRGDAFDKGYDFSLSAMRSWEDANAVCLGEGASLMLLLAVCDTKENVMEHTPSGW